MPLALHEDIPSGKNIFTVLVGKNGTGKSRLLSEIAKESIVTGETGSAVYDDLDYGPKVIAVSTSPFDKFPITRKYHSLRRYQDNYRYVGMRGRPLLQL